MIAMPRVRKHSFSDMTPKFKALAEARRQLAELEERTAREQDQTLAALPA